MRPGTTIAGRFVVERHAGSGGMGAVYRALDTSLDRPVAIKVLADESAFGDRFVREAQLLAQLEHPAIVRYVAHGQTDEGDAFLAMAWLEGRDLAARITEGPLGLAEAIEVARRVASALGAAHRAGIVHRDVKPSNVFLPDDDLARATVIDFGVARGLGRGTVMTKTGALVGTPGYMSPEQARGDREIDARADVFALGCVLFECLTGKPPFAADTMFAVLAKVLLEDRPCLSDLAPDAPPELDRLVARMMDRDRMARPADGDAAADELSRVALALGDGARPLGLRPTITRVERRMRCVMLVVPSDLPDGVAGADDATQLVSAAATATAVGAPEGLAGTFTRVTELARSLRGHVDVLPGGALVVTHAGGSSLGEQAARAARCALAVRDMLPGGAISLSMGRAADDATTSDTVDRAAERLAAVQARGGELDGVLVDDLTAGMLADAFDIARGPHGLTLRGAITSGEERGLLGKGTPCVGRERELSMLGLLIDECFEERVARAAIVVGGAGVGKSRVRRELVARLRQRGDDAQAWIGLGDAIRAGSPYGLLGRAVASGLGAASWPPDERRARLRARVASRLPAGEVSRVTSFLGELSGLPADASPELAAARQDPLLMGDQTRRAFLDFIAAECAAHPIVLVLEDLHFGDWPSIKLVDAALAALVDRPLFVLATARPEAFETFPRLWSERTPQEVRLGPLTPRAVERLVRGVLGAACDDDIVARVVANAAGHPLHVEEILRVIVEGGEGALPDTLLAMIDARLDHLDPAARRVLRAASVMGRSFWASGLLEMLGAEGRADTDRWLGELSLREWIIEAKASRFAGEIEHAFRQDLVQEAAYARLTGSDRRTGHRLAAAWLEGVGEVDAMVLSHHLELGGEGARAAEHLARAAEQALDGNDFVASAARAARAARLAASDLVVGRARAVEAEAHLHLGDFAPARELGLAAMEKLTAGSPELYRAAGVVALAGARLGDLETTRRVAHMLLEAPVLDAVVLSLVAAAATTATQLAVAGDFPLADAILARIGALDVPGRTVARGQLARARGARAAFAGEISEGQAELRLGIAAFDAAGDMRSACSLRKTLGWYAAESGALEEGERALREAVEQADRLGLPNLTAHARHDLVSPLVRLHKLDEAERTEREALAVIAAQGDRRLASSAHAMLSFIARSRGDLDEAERAARRSLAIAPAAPARLTALAHLASALVAGGRDVEALQAAREGIAILGEHGASEEGVTLLYLAAACAAARLGDADEARATIARARDDVLKRAASLGPDLRAAFLQRIQENADVLALADEWLAGSPDEPTATT